MKQILTLNHLLDLEQSQISVFFVHGQLRICIISGYFMQSMVKTYFIIEKKKKPPTEMVQGGRGHLPQQVGFERRGRKEYDVSAH